MAAPDLTEMAAAVLASDASGLQGTRAAAATTQHVGPLREHKGDADGHQSSLPEQKDRKNGRDQHADELKRDGTHAREPTRDRALRDLARPWLCVYLAMLIATLSTAAAFFALIPPSVDGLARHLIGARLDADRNPPPHLDHVLVLTAHNLPILAWPLLLGVIGVEHHRHARLLTDTVAAVWIIVNVLPVGVALGAYGTPLLPYLPQVPLECAGLALGATVWLRQRHRPLTIIEGFVVFALLAVIVLSAATLETVAVPHRPQSNRSDTATNGHPGRIVPVATQIAADRTTIWIETFVPSIVKDD
jgi:hypothetical protein